MFLVKQCGFIHRHCNMTVIAKLEALRMRQLSNLAKKFKNIDGDNEDNFNHLQKKLFGKKVSDVRICSTCNKKTPHVHRNKKKFLADQVHTFGSQIKKNKNLNVVIKFKLCLLNKTAHRELKTHT